MMLSWSTPGLEFLPAFSDMLRHGGDPPEPRPARPGRVFSGATKTDLAALKSELKADIAVLRTELKADIAGIKAAIAGIKADIRLLRWQIAVTWALSLAILVKLFVH